MIDKETLERQQVWIYFAAIAAGLALGNFAASFARTLELAVWPALSLLLYATFTQVPLVRLPAAVKDGRFVAAALLGNFVVLPLLLGAILWVLPQDDAVRLGLVLVLLVPCTDWFITFAHQAGGDLRRAIALTPVLLIVQMVLLPLYVWLFMGERFVEMAISGPMLTVFVTVIVLPLGAAWLSERWAAGRPTRVHTLARLGAWPVPLLAVVLFLVAASQAGTALHALPRMGGVLAACVAFLIGAALCAGLLGKMLGLPAPQATTLLFSLSTRNSFVVLPIALALPPMWEMAAIVIVFQSLVELFGMLALLALMARRR